MLPAGCSSGPDVKFAGQTGVRVSLHYLVANGPHATIYGLVDASCNVWHAGVDGG